MAGFSAEIFIRTLTINYYIGLPQALRDRGYIIQSRGTPIEQAVFELEQYEIQLQVEKSRHGFGTAPTVGVVADSGRPVAAASGNNGGGGSSGGSSRFQKDIKDIECYNCLKKGHYQRDCPQPPRNSRGSGGGSGSGSGTNRVIAAVTGQVVAVNNGETTWRGIWARVRTVLVDSGLPHTYWPYAASYVNDCRNALLVAGGKTSPYEKFAGRKPDLTWFKPFGCVGYIHIPEETRHERQQTRAEG